MTKLFTLLIGALIVAAPAVQADVAFDPGTLGHMKAVLELCSRVDTQKASQYLLQMKSVIGTADRKTVEQAARTIAYREAYDSVRSNLDDKEPNERTAACNDYLSAQ